MKYHGFPNVLASESEKGTKKYGLAFFRSMYREWAGEDGGLLDQRTTRFETARKFAGGYQDPDQYRDLIAVSGDMSYMNLDWSIVPIIPKFVDLVVNSITNYEYSIKARAIDPVAQDQKKKKEMELKTKLVSKNFLLNLQEMSGVPMIGENEFLPESEDEIELYMELGYKQAAEIAIEQGLALAMDINDWNELAKRVVRDLVVLGTGAVKTEVDHRGVIIRYVDPMYLVTSYVQNPDYKDASWAGEIRRVTISSLKAEAGAQLDETAYQRIAERFIGKYDNPRSFSLEPILSQEAVSYEYDTFLVDVMEGQFIVPNELKAEKKYNQYGNYTVHRKKDTYNPPKKSKFEREMKTTTYECKYSGKWIIGTEYIYDYGKAKNQIRAKSSLHKTKLDFIIYSPNLNRKTNQSLCERMIPFGNQIQLIHLKLQHAIAKARPKGMAIEVGGIENVQNGKGGTFKPLEVLDIYDQTGTYFFRYIDDSGQPNQARPITELEGGVGSVINEFLLEYDHNLRMLRDVTGINEAREGSMPDKDSVVGVAKMNLIASNMATKGINDAYLSIYRRTAESAILMIQDLVYYDKPYKGYIRSLGEHTMNVINVTKDVSLHEFGLIIEAAPDEAERQTLELDMRSAIDQKELRPEDAAMIRAIKNTKLATQYMLQKRKEYMREQMQMAQANAKANAEQQAMSAQAAAEAEVQKAQMLSELKKQEEQHAAQIKAELMKREHEFKMQQIALEKGIEMQAKQAEEQEDVPVT
jgi:hypothetical protein